MQWEAGGCVFRLELSRFLVLGIPGRLAKAAKASTMCLPALGQKRKDVCRSTTAVVVPGIPAQHMSKTWADTFGLTPLGGLKVAACNCVRPIFKSLWDIQRNPRQWEKEIFTECIHAYRCLHATGGLFWCWKANLPSISNNTPRPRPQPHPHHPCHPCHPVKFWQDEVQWKL